MQKYIDATKFSRGLAGAALRADYGEEVNRIVDIFCKAIMDEPPADVEEVVRCKNCTHGHWNQETCHGRCVHYCDLTDLQIDKEHFCSYGERKKS